ncbi:hypothetical protein AGMMS4957_19660 [Bacteroidia bacterium]|nr:hypothetical protein AGMMS4957_19660 [Bacteroidia bacterium]
MNINSRIKEVRKKRCNDSNTEFAKAVGETKQAVNNWIRDDYSIGLSVLSKLSDAFPDLNLDWLITGRGDMELSESQATNGISIGRDNSVMNVNGNNSGHNVKMGDNSHFNPADLSNLTEMLKDKDYIIAKLRKQIEDKDKNCVNMLSEKDKFIEKTITERDAIIKNMMVREQEIVKNSYERNEENQKRMDKKDERIKELQEKIFELIDKAK